LYDTGEGLREFLLSVPHREVEIVPIETEKVFVVDFKRPLSGTLAYTADFDEQQYFDEISGQLEDTTITDVAALVATVAPLFGKSASAPVDPTSEVGRALITNKRVVAYKRFDIDACDFEAQLRGFLEEHVNCDHTCNGYGRLRSGDPIDPRQGNAAAIRVPGKQGGGDAMP
jgi:hypothetical protein